MGKKKTDLCFDAILDAIHENCVQQIISQVCQNDQKNTHKFNKSTKYT